MNESLKLECVSFKKKTGVLFKQWLCRWSLSDTQIFLHQSTTQEPLHLAKKKWLHHAINWVIALMHPFDVSVLLPRNHSSFSEGGGLLKGVGSVFSQFINIINTLLSLSVALSSLRLSQTRFCSCHDSKKTKKAQKPFFIHVIYFRAQL